MTKIRSSFSSMKDSHLHSLQTLELLEGYNDFMESITTMADFGSGQEGLDIEWWATRMSNDEVPAPLNIECTAVDIMESCRMTSRYKNVKYTNQDLEKEKIVKASKEEKKKLFVFLTEKKILGGTLTKNNDSLFKFFVDFHNEVNIQTNKPVMSYEDAYKLYSGNIHLTISK